MIMFSSVRPDESCEMVQGDMDELLKPKLEKLMYEVGDSKKVWFKRKA